MDPTAESLTVTRRRFLARSVGAAVAGLAGGSVQGWPALAGVNPSSAGDEVLPVAAVVTVYTPNSHADVIVGKILEGWQQDGGAGPRLKVVSLFVDQLTEADLSRSLAQKHGFRIAGSIDEALTLGTDRLQVAGVLSIGEHGNYPFTAATQQHEYPRRRFFEGIVETFRRVKQVVPVFNDKHLAYRWDDAKFMYETARQMQIPLLAGSSIPVAWRIPALEVALESEIEEALSIGYGGFEAYGFHALEGHQCQIERRRGGESGVAAVEALRGPDLVKAAEKGRFSDKLFRAALATFPGAPNPTYDWAKRDDAGVYLLEHRDGLRSSVVIANGLAGYFAFAAKLKGKDEPVATWFKLQEGKPFGHFAYLLRAIESTIRTRKAVYPVERTLLTTGVLDRVMHSLANGGQRFETPELAIRYLPGNWPFANRADSPLNLPSDA